MLDEARPFARHTVLLAALLAPAMVTGAVAQSAPAAGRISATVRTVDLARAVQRVQRDVRGAGGGRGVLRFEVGDGRLRVAATVDLVTVIAEEPCSSAGSGVAVVRAAGLMGRPATTYLDPKFAIEALQALTSSSVVLAIAKPLEPVTLSDPPGFTALIMPMKP